MALRAVDQLLGGAEHRLAGLVDMADGRANIGERAGHLAGDIAGAERDRVELGGLLLEHGAQVRVRVVDRADARMHIGERVSVCSTASWMSFTCLAMSSVACAVWPASFFTPLATTAKPAPASPARTASMLAMSASSDVCRAMVWMKLTTSPMRIAACARPRTVSSAEARSATARSLAARDTPISPAERLRRVRMARAEAAMALTSSDADAAASEADAIRTCMWRLRSARSAAVLPMRPLPSAKALVTSSTAERKRR